MSWSKEQLAEHYARLTGRDVLGVDSDREDRTRQGCGESVAESLIEAECTKILEQDGWRALRTDPVSDRGRGKGFGEVGMADHLYIRYCPPVAASYGGFKADASILWIEFKRPGQKARKHQLGWHQKERARGALTLIAGVDFTASVAGFREWYAQSGLRRRRDG